MLPIFFLAPELQLNARCVGREAFYWLAEMQLAAAGADVVSRFVVEIGERDRGHSHVASGRRFHGFAHDLGGGGNGNQVEFLAESADQDGPPEAVYGGFGLTVLIEPVLEGLSSVALLGQRKRDQRAGDGELVGRAQE